MYDARIMIIPIYPGEIRPPSGSQRPRFRGLRAPEGACSESRCTAALGMAKRIDGGEA